MSEIMEKIGKDIISSMKNKNRFRVSVLKLIKNELLMSEKNNEGKNETTVISAYHKRLSKNLTVFKGEDLVVLEQELAIISEYLPRELTEEELIQLVGKYIHLGNIGMIMKNVKSEVKGVFNGALVKSLIEQKLGK